MSDVVNFVLYFLLEQILTLQFWRESERKSILYTSPAARVKLAARRSVNYREVDADYPTRLIGGSNDDSEIFTAIYRRPTVGSPRFLTRASRKASRNNDGPDRDIGNHPP